jgi:hypothetical protein
VTPLPHFPLNPWGQLPGGKSLYEALRNEACQHHPESFDAAFRQLCSRARHITSTRRWLTWSSDFRRAQDREDLEALARIDPDAFLAKPENRSMIDSTPDIFGTLLLPSFPLTYKIPPQPGLVAS